MSARKRGPFDWIIGWFIDARLIALLLAALLVGAGVYVAPFSLDLDVPRSPVPVDAIPDIGENQQIVFTEWPGRSPRDVEDQVTYPLTTALLGIAGVRTVRSSSAFGFSMVFVIFEDDVEFYWSRTRVLEKLASLSPGTLPDDVTPTLGPDATALGQIFWYTLEGRDPEGNTVGGWDLDELRAIQDWTVRYALQAADGVAEVASIGGHVREYQVEVDPDALRAHGVTLSQVAAAVRESNLDAGARTLEINGVEYVVRGLGRVRGLEDIELAAVDSREGTPIRVRDVARVTLGPALRAGALDDEGAPAVGGVVVARYRENPLAAIDSVKAQIEKISAGLPKRVLEDGTVSQVTIVPFYDRTELIEETLGTLGTALTQQLLITVIVVLVMLRNMRSSLLIASILPLGVLTAFVAMKATGVDANVMALGGIAIAIGTMVDIGIVFVENITQHLERSEPGGDRAGVVRRAVAEVAPAVTTSVLTTSVAFIPVFGLVSTELKLFAPLALTKIFAMLGALTLAIVLVPGLSLLVLRRKSAPASSGGGEGVAGRLRSLVRPSLARDLILVGLGVALAGYALSVGLMVIALGLVRIARPLFPPAWAAWRARAEDGLAVAAVAVALASSWAPLGPGEGLFMNALFVVCLLAVVLGALRLVERLYPRLLSVFLRRKALFLVAPGLVLLFGATAWLGFPKVFGWLPEAARTSPPGAALAHALPGFGREFLPPFDEGSFLYMPTTMPHASIGEVQEMLSEMDARIAQIPEVDRVVGKLGRAESAIDPAPVSMLETVITIVPEFRVEEDGTRVRMWREHIRGPRDIWDEIVRAADQPGFTSAPLLMPIQARLVMLQSGMRAPMGVKIQGPDLESIERFSLAVEEALREVPGVRREAVYAERVVGKPYLEIEIDRDAIARYGVSVVDVQEAMRAAVGGVELTRTVEGRERFAVRVRYMRERRGGVEDLEEIALPTADGTHVPLGQLAEIRYVRGPETIRSEDTFLTSYVLFDREPDVAEVTAVERAREALEARIAEGSLEVPSGVSYSFAGSYENQVRSERRLAVLVPLAMIIVFILLYLQFRRVVKAALIFTEVAIAVAGAFVLLWLYAQPWFLDFELFGASMRELFRVGPVNLSVAVWVGIIALIGIATDDGVVMTSYLKQRFDEEPPTTREEIRERTLEAALRRVRPCLMTTATTILALLPVITSRGRGADLMMPLALPAVGGMAISLITLFVVPVLHSLVEERRAERVRRG